jgi:hypothetical protein
MIGYITVGIERGRCYSQNAVPNPRPYNVKTINPMSVHKRHFYNHEQGTRTDFKKHLTAFSRVRKLTNIKVKNKNTKISER